MSREPTSERRDLDAVQERIFRRVPETKELWERAQPALQIALLFTRMRKAKGLTQSDVAGRAEWDKSYVSRLESGQGGIPDIATFSRYASACGVFGGLIVGTPSDRDRFHVLDAVTLNALPSPEREDPLETFRDHDVEVKQQAETA